MAFDSDPDGPGEHASAPDDEPLVSPLDGESPASDEPASGPATDLAGAQGPVAPPSRPDSHNMLPPRERRRSRLERFLVRLVATGGIVGIGVAIAAIMVSQHSQGWLIGLVVSIVSVVLAAILWSSRQL